MEINNLQKTKELLPLVKIDTKFKLTVTKNLEKKIRYLCSKLPNNEYSGTLFYQVKGSFENKNLHIICKDFYLQDVGEATFTEFQNDNTLTEYIIENNLFECYHGLLHSHQSLKSYFSSTDINTLREEGNDTNHFVSLIINNEGEYCAAVTRKVTNKYNLNITGNVTSSYNSWDNVPKEKVSKVKRKKEEEKSFIEYYMLQINKEESPYIPDSLEVRLNELVNKKNNRNSRLSYWGNYNGNYNNKGFNNDWLRNTGKSISNSSQLSLFNNDDNYENKYAFINELSEEAKEYGITPKLLKNQVTQLITCNLFGHYNSNIELDKWAINMVEVYDKRFKDIKSFESYAYAIIEFLEDDLISITSKFPGKDLEIQSVWRTELIKELSKYKTNKYIEKYIEALEIW